MVIKPIVSFIVLNWNQAGMTAECLDSLKKLEYPNINVIVVDNGSSDGSGAFIRDNYPWVTLIEQTPNIGYSPGNNVGIEYALKQGTDYLFLLNNDTEVDPLMLSRLIEVSESNSQFGMIGPTMYYFEPMNMVWGGENYIKWDKAQTFRRHFMEIDDGLISLHESPIEVDYIDTCAVLVKREVVEKIGLMNEAYFINFDDLEWNVRAHKSGYKIIYVPNAKMWHKVSATMGQASPVTTYYMTRNSLLFFWENTPGIRKFLALLHILLRTLWIVVVWTIKREYRSDIFRRKRNANLLAMRDFCLGRFGKMGEDVANICNGE
jgi:hypothetical protein